MGILVNLPPNGKVFNYELPRSL